MAEKDVNCPVNVWTPLTTNVVEKIRVQNRGFAEVLIKVTADTTEPTNTDGAVEIGGKNILLLTTPLSELFANFTEGYVWAMPIAHATVLSVSHA